MTITNTRPANLTEARSALLDRGVYPVDVLAENQETTKQVAMQVQLLEQIVETYKDSLPTLHMLLQGTSTVLFEGSTDNHAATKIPGLEAAMINYAFVSETLSHCVRLAATALQAKMSPEARATKSLAEAFGKDAVSLLEFCMKKSTALKLMEGDTGAVVRLLARDLATRLPVADLVAVCESAPAINLYVNKKVHTQIAAELLV